MRIKGLVSLRFRRLLPMV